MLEAGFDIRSEHYLRGLVSTTRNRLLMDLKMKSRILVQNGTRHLNIYLVYNPD